VSRIKGFHVSHLLLCHLILRLSMLNCTSNMMLRTTVPCFRVSYFLWLYVVELCIVLLSVFITSRNNRDCGYSLVDFEVDWIPLLISMKSVVCVEMQKFKKISRLQNLGKGFCSCVYTCHLSFLPAVVCVVYWHIQFLVANNSVHEWMNWSSKCAFPQKLKQVGYVACHCFTRVVYK